MKRNLFTAAAGFVLTLGMLAGCSASVATAAETAVPTVKPAVVPVTSQNATESATKTPKYVFLFIGDGMSHVQINAAQVLLGDNKPGEVAVKSLNFTQFPIAGVATTYDSTSFCPDSASTATAISCGVKTHSGVIGLNVDKLTKPVSITELLKADGKKIGIVSSVTINHATPAAFYAHIASRNDYYEIALQMAAGDFDYYGGGTISQANGKDSDRQSLYDVLKMCNYTVADTKEAILALNSSSPKVYAVSPVTQDSGALPYAIDEKEGDLTLVDFVQKGIDVLDNDNGFFLMCESGKIDWACHANDAMAAITDVLAFQDAIQVAVDFANAHPDETLILVTGDHETGGMTIGYAATGYNTAFDILSHQKISYVAFDELISSMKAANPKLTFADVYPVIKENFGLIAPNDADAAATENKSLVMTDFEYEKLQNGFKQSLLPSEKRSTDAEASLLYGTYDPLSVTLTHILNNKAGIGWTSYAHTGTPVPVYAMGVGADVFGGSYDNTDIFKKLVEVCRINVAQAA
jgi:alkaline phosphatase